MDKNSKNRKSFFSKLKTENSKSNWMERKYYAPKRKGEQGGTGKKQRLVVAVPASVKYGRASQNARIHTHYLYATGSVVATDAGGELNNHFNVSPRNDADNWADFSGVYEQYQVQSMTVIVIPLHPATTSDWAGDICHYLISGIDRNSSTDPTSEAEVLGRRGARVLNTQDLKEHHITWKILPEEKLTWTNVAADQTGCIQLYGTGGATKNQFYVIQKWFVKFKSSQ